MGTEVHTVGGVRLSQVRVLFLDGIGCNPRGYKPRYIRGLGYEVLAPMLPDADFAGAVRTAAEAARQFHPDVIAGYSRRGGVALALNDERTPRVLIAPALYWVPADRTFRGRLVILHSPSDDGLPLGNVEEFLSGRGLDRACLRIVGDDRTMIDPPALTALRSALAEVTGPTDS